MSGVASATHSLSQGRSMDDLLGRLALKEAAIGDTSLLVMND